MRTGADSKSCFRADDQIISTLLVSGDEAVLS